VAISAPADVSSWARPPPGPTCVAIHAGPRNELKKVINVVYPPGMESNKVTGAVYLPAVKRFNHSLKILARDLSKRCPNDPMVFRIHKRTMSLVDVLPIFVIDTVGPYLYSYREQIYGGSEKDEEFFLEHTFETEVKGLDNPESAEMVSYLIPKAKACALSMPPEDQKEYKELVISMLDDYIEYLSILNGQ
jgi:hypothetical protein